MLDARTGAPLQRVRIPDTLALLAVDQRQHHAFASSFDTKRVWMLDTRSGRVLGARSIGALPVLLTADQRTGRVFVVATSTLHGGPARSWQVVVLDARTGATLHRVGIPSGLPVNLLTDTQSGRVYIAVASRAAPGAVGWVLLLDGWSGAIVHRGSVGALPGSLAVDTRAARLYVLNRGAPSVPPSISVLDSRTGVLVRTIATAAQPQALAVDSASGTLFQLGQGGTQRDPAPNPFLALVGRARRLFGLATPPAQAQQYGILTATTTRK